MSEGPQGRADRVRGGMEERQTRREWAETEETGPNPAYSSGAQEIVPIRTYLAWGVTLVVLVGWCIVALGIGVNFAHTFWEWLPILILGGGVPALVLWQANRVLAPRRETRPLASAKDKERELLQALAERGEVTPITAAIKTSLTAGEASRMLENLARDGYLRLHVSDGVPSYALGDQDRRGLERPEAPAESEAPNGVSNEVSSETRQQPLDDPLSERELEVLALVASGRTGSEIAADLFVAVGTVKTHTNNIYRKLGVNKRSEALARARDLDLLP